MEQEYALPEAVVSSREGQGQVWYSVVMLLLVDNPRVLMVVLKENGAPAYTVLPVSRMLNVVPLSSRPLQEMVRNNSAHHTHTHNTHAHTHTNTHTYTRTILHTYTHTHIHTHITRAHTRASARMRTQALYGFPMLC